MSRLIQCAIYVCFFLTGGAWAITAQYALGDHIIGGQVYSIGSPLQTVLLGVSPFNKVYTLTRLSAPPNAVAASPDNRGIWVLEGSALVHVATDGKVTSVVAVPRYSNAMVIDADGTAVIGSGDGYIYRYRNSRLTTLHTSLQRVTGLGIELASGDVVASTSLGFIYRQPMYGPRTTIAILKVAAMGGSAFHSDPYSGAMVGFYNWGVHLVHCTPPVSLKTLYTYPGTVATISSGDYDPADGKFVFPISRSFPTPNHTLVCRVDTRSSVVTTQVVIKGMVPWGSGMSGRRHLSLFETARVGQPCRFRVSFPGESSLDYVVGLSFGFRPGFALANGRVHLNMDALFWLSMSNTGWFKNFRGTLDSNGEGFPVLSIPQIKDLSRIRFFAAAVTARRGNLRSVSAPIGITVY